MRQQLPDVKIEQFEGPYDLLLELAKKEKIKLSEVSLQCLTQEFLAYMKQHEIPAELIASFVMVASSLLLLKAKQVLPTLTEEEDEELTNFEERLALYAQYRTAAEKLGEMWNTAWLLPANFFGEGEYKVAYDTSSFPSISASLLADVFQICIGRIPVPSQVRTHLTLRGRSLKELYSLFQERLEQTKKIVFQEAMRDMPRQEQAVSFLAILEMARNQEIMLEQPEPFAHLILHKL